MDFSYTIEANGEVIAKQTRYEIVYPKSQPNVITDMGHAFVISPYREVTTDHGFAVHDTEVENNVAQWENEGGMYA